MPKGEFIVQLVFSVLITLIIVILYISVPFIAFGKGKTKEYLSNHKATFIVYFLLRLLVTFTMIRSIYQKNYYDTFLCLVTLALFMAPMFIENRLKIELPTVFEIIVLFFIFNAEILGEIGSYYTRFKGWDTALHTINGFLCAAVGFSLFDMLNKEIDVPVKLSPFYLSLMAFCFSMTIGILWEFIEFSADMLFMKDMQKDFLVSRFGSVFINSEGLNDVVLIKDIVSTTIHTANGSIITIEGGYLDIGIIDTMKDLLVNFIGAVVFSIPGYFLYKYPESHNLIKKFMIKVPKKN